MTCIKTKNRIKQQYNLQFIQKNNYHIVYLFDTVTE